MVQDSGGVFLSGAGRGFGMRDPGAAAGAAAGGGAAAAVHAHREAGVLATAEDDAETAEAGLAEGAAGGGLHGARHLASGAGGEADLAAVRGCDQ